MKKVMIILLTIAVCSSNIECTKKKMNRFNEFLKGSVALGAAAGLAYLAYEAPIGKIQEQFTKLKHSIFTPDTLESVDSWCSNKTEILFNKLRTSTPGKNFDKSKIFSFAMIIPAWELLKYSLDKLGNCVRSHKKDSSCKEE